MGMAVKLDWHTKASPSNKNTNHAHIYIIWHIVFTSVSAHTYILAGQVETG